MSFDPVKWDLVLASSVGKTNEACFEHDGKGNVGSSNQLQA